MRGLNFPNAANPERYVLIACSCWCYFSLWIEVALCQTNNGQWSRGLPIPEIVDDFVTGDALRKLISNIYPPYCCDTLLLPDPKLLGVKRSVCLEYGCGSAKAWRIYRVGNTSSDLSLVQTEGLVGQVFLGCAVYLAQGDLSTR